MKHKHFSIPLYPGSFLCSVSVADAVTKRKHELDGNALHVTKPPPKKARKSESDDQKSDDYESTQSKVARRTIIVEGVTKSTSEELLRMLFESTRRTGGGEIEDMEYQPESERATITFQSEDGRFDYIHILEKILL